MISGQLTVKPANTPQVGQIKNFTWEDHGNYTKVRVSPPEKGGRPHKILKVAQKTDYSDSYNNLCFFVDIEPTSELPSQPPPRNNSAGMTKDDYWAAKDKRDIRREQRDIEKEPLIQRMHAQHMAVLYCALKPEEASKITPEGFRKIVDWMQLDAFRPPVGKAEKEPEPEEPSGEGERPF